MKELREYIGNMRRLEERYKGLNPNQWHGYMLPRSWRVLTEKAGCLIFLFKPWGLDPLNADWGYKVVIEIERDIW